jgi:hypothetical protein
MGPWTSEAWRYEALDRLREKHGMSSWRVRRADGVECALERLAVGEVEAWSELEAFEREAEILKGFAHPAVPRWLETFRTEDAICIVTEPAEGEPIRGLIASRRTLSAAELGEVLAQGLDVLAALHGRNPPIMHRDLSPEHVRVAFDAGGPRLVLTGFGSARAGPGSGLSAVGTFGTVAPEQAIGQGVPASDLYGLGVTLLALASHCLPEALAEADGRLRTAAFAPLPERVRVVLEAMVEPRLDRRLPSAELGLAVLRGKRPVSVITPKTRAGWAERLRAHRGKVTVAAAALALVGWRGVATRIPEGARSVFRDHGARVSDIEISGHVFASLDWREGLFVWQEGRGAIAEVPMALAEHVDDVALGVSGPSGGALVLCGRDGARVVTLTAEGGVTSAEAIEGPCLATSWRERPLALVERAGLRERAWSADRVVVAVDTGEVIRTVEREPRCDTREYMGHVMAGRAPTVASSCELKIGYETVGWVVIDAPGGVRVLKVPSAVLDLSLSADGLKLAIVSRGVTLVDVMTGSETGHFPEVDGVALSEDGGAVALLRQGERVGDVATVSLVRLADGAELKLLRGVTGHFNTMRWLPDATAIATGGKDERVTVWSVP